MTRRRMLAGLGASMLAACSPRFSPKPKVSAGTTRHVEPYGDERLQRGEWWLPEAGGLLPTVVLVHGGYWRPTYDRSLEDAVAADLCSRGYLCWNIDYAASDRLWPATLDDVAAGYDHLVTGAFADRVDRARIAVVGHSAGGHLALWLSSRHRIGQGGVGLPASGSPRPRLCVAQAPIAALARGAREGLGGGAVVALMGGLPADVPARYAIADPVALLPTGVRTVLIHGTSDDTVPLSQSQAYVDDATRVGDHSTLRSYRGGHFEHLDPTSEAVALLRQALVDQV
ncbi:MAG: alpha/beta hydrolase [Frankiales bacterium]|nr:alpha/beta hydrolase [Frankiales bacterium]